jgi:hypothetical protein
MTTLLLTLCLFTAAVHGDAGEEHIYVADAKTLLGAARHAVNVDQLALSLQSRGGLYVLPENENNTPLFQVSSHERPLFLSALPANVDWMLCLRAFGAAVGAVLLIYAQRVLCLARRRRLYGNVSTVPLPIDYRLQKSHMRRMQEKTK